MKVKAKVTLTEIILIILLLDLLFLMRVDALLANTPHHNMLAGCASANTDWAAQFVLVVIGSMLVFVCSSATAGSIQSRFFLKKVKKHD